MSKEVQAICNYCRKTNLELDVPIITGAVPGAFICKNCIDTAYKNLIDTLEENEDEEIEIIDGLSMKPSEIKAHLDEYVIGQDLAKKKLATGVYNHYKRMRKLEKEGSVEIEKSNILMVGSTGSGKTYLLKTLSKFLDVPLAISDATNLTQAGYVGEDPENILRRLIEAADGDIEKAQRGIVYIDEIDKLGRKGESVSISRDVSGEGVQQALLKIIEGTIASVPPKGGRKHPNQEFIKIDTTNILFILGGAFDGIEKIIQRRGTEKTLGFGAKIESKKEVDLGKIYAKVLPEDLLKFGIIPEFIGRIPVVATLDLLDENALMTILQEPKNALVKQYKKLLELDDVELEFEEEALRAIAKKAIERNTGARGLRSIVESVMMESMYEVPSRTDVKKVLVTKESVEEKTNPIMILKDQEESA